MALTDKQRSNLKANSIAALKAYSVPCVDCNIVWHPLVMTFDHGEREKKEFNLSEARTRSPKVFKAEMDKCDVVCRNCHQMREYLRDIGLFNPEDWSAHKHKYYERLIPYLCGGAMLRKDAFNLVKVKL